MKCKPEKIEYNHIPPTHSDRCAGHCWHPEEMGCSNRKPKYPLICCNCGTRFIPTPKGHGPYFSGNLIPSDSLPRTLPALPADGECPTCHVIKKEKPVWMPSRIWNYLRHLVIIEIGHVQVWGYTECHKEGKK